MNFIDLTDKELEVVISVMQMVHNRPILWNQVPEEDRDDFNSAMRGLVDSD